MTQLYILEVERYLSRNSQKKNGAPLPKEYSEVVIDSLEQVHWKEDSKFDSLKDAQIQSKRFQQSDKMSLSQSRILRKKPLIYKK
ncbi:hypothetical protein LEP1GSC101_0035 [Leptospira borgpetersenii str. UI 09149]|nr:hypothetical protein LEP1GSC101_0035 [Leptospira borgpetersenii str. UI 09149]